MSNSTPIKVLVPEVGHTAGWQDTQAVVAFMVTITTPKISYGGTDANVYLELANSHYLLDKPGYDDFKQGDTDSYYFDTNTTLGRIRESQIRIYHDNTRDKAGWYCGEVVIHLKFKDTSVMRQYKKWPDVGWLALDESPYYTIEAFLQENSEPDPEFCFENPYKNYSYYYKGQCHCHSTESDGKDTPLALEQAYKDKGYAFVCLTDHNRNTKDPFVDNLLHIDSGEDGESDRHHILALSINKDRLDIKRDKNLDGIDDRPSRPCDNIQERINYISSIQNTVSVLAHPTGSHAPEGIGFTLDELKVNIGYTGIEICNTADSYPIWSVYTPYDINPSNTFSWWDETLKHKKYGVWGFATDDCHDINEINFNRGWIVVNSNRNILPSFPYINYIKEFESEHYSKLHEYSESKKSEILFKAYRAYYYKSILQKDIIDNIKRGNFYSVVRSPKQVDTNNKGTTDIGPSMKINVVNRTITVNTDLSDSIIRFIIGNGRQNINEKNIHVPQTIIKTGRTASYDCNGKELYVRIEIEQERPSGSGNSKEKYIAFSQPIFVQSTREARERDYSMI